MFTKQQAIGQLKADITVVVGSKMLLKGWTLESMTMALAAEEFSFNFTLYWFCLGNNTILGNSYSMVERAVSQFLTPITSITVEQPVPCDQGGLSGAEIEEIASITLVTEEDIELAAILTQAANDLEAQIKPILEHCNKSEKELLQQLVNELSSDLNRGNQLPKDRLSTFMQYSRPEVLQDRLDSIRPTIAEKFTALLKTIKENLIKTITFGLIKPDLPVSVKFTRCVAAVADSLKDKTTVTESLLRPAV